MMIYVALWNPHPVLQHWLRPQFQALVDAACEKQGQGWMPVGLHHLVSVRVQLLRRGVSQRVQHDWIHARMGTYLCWCQRGSL